MPYATFTGRTMEVQTERTQVHSFAAPQPMQKNSLCSTSNATGEPQPHAAGLGSFAARRKRWGPAGMRGRRAVADSKTPSLMESPGCLLACSWTSPP